jgi:hypothetical protein
MGALVALSLFGGSESPVIFLAQAIVGAAVVALLLALWPMLRFKPGERQLTAGAEGLDLIEGSRHRHVPWRSVRQVSRFKASVFVQARNLNAFVIPVAAFDSETTCDEFIELSERWRLASAA